MADGQSGTAPAMERGNRWPTAVASLSSGRCVLRLVVLAAAAMGRFQRGNGGHGALAMAGSSSVCAGIRCCPALRLGRFRRSHVVGSPRRSAFKNLDWAGLGEHSNLILSVLRLKHLANFHLGLHAHYHKIKKSR